MSSPRTLVLGVLPPDATPDSHYAAGVWCFAGQEAAHPGWETRFRRPPDPLADPDVLARAGLEAQGLAAQCIPRVAGCLAPHNQLPPVYWEVALANWSIMAAQLIVGYQYRIRAMCDAWGKEPLRVPLLPADCPFVFGREQDCIMGGSLNALFTHWLLSRLLEVQWPAAWERTDLPVPPVGACRHDAPAPAGVAALKARLHDTVQHVLRNLPFPKVRGFSVGQSMRFSCALLGNTNQADHSRRLAPLAEHAPTLPLDPLPLFLRYLPRSLREAAHPQRIKPARRKRTRVASITAYEDTAYRLRLARWRAAGHKLVFIQHGGNYGNVRTACMTPMLEYTQHAFITWGWTQQTPEQAHFVPLPHGLLDGVRDAHRETTPSLLYVGTEISVFPYRMDSRPTPEQYVQYRAAKADFFHTLPQALHTRCLYRPYFDVPGTLQDKEWLLPRFPGVRLCTGPLEGHILACRLLVLDHHGTTLLQAFAANVPTLLFWDARAWGLCPETEALLPQLAHAGIWHPDAAAAARHAARVWDDVTAWWGSPAVQEARAAWCRQYALTTSGAVAPLWQHTLQHI